MNYNDDERIPRIEVVIEMRFELILGLSSFQNVSKENNKLKKCLKFYSFIVQSCVYCLSSK